jgi:sialate O-acetylesterase
VRTPLPARSARPRHASLARAVLLLTLATTTLIRAEVRLGTPFQDHAVLQRDRPVRIWGWAQPGERVRVTLGELPPSVTNADPTGRWEVTLPALPGSLAPRTLAAEGSTRAFARDVLVGEVWLAAGQSNMEWRLKSSSAGEADQAAADLPAIRQLKVARNPRSERQQEATAAWSVCSPTTAGEFSAVGFHFARELWLALRVPVGLVNCSHGNSAVEGWMSREALAAEPTFRRVTERWDEVLARYPAARERHEAALQRWEKEAAAARARGAIPPNRPAAPMGPGHHQEPAALFNGMIAPVLPYALRGFLWYQGEGNARRAGEYERLFSALIGQWRHDFQAAEAPFFWVQLPGLGRMPPTTTPDDWVALRAAQTATLALPATGQAVTIDVGDPADIHPLRKREVGERLARLARRRVYGESVLDEGPNPKWVQRSGAFVEIEFVYAEGGLRMGGAPDRAFELAGPDGRFAAATEIMMVAENRLRLSAPGVDRPAHVRHAWQALPAGWLLNASGLPTPPFSLPVD